MDTYAAVAPTRTMVGPDGSRRASSVGVARIAIGRFTFGVADGTSSRHRTPSHDDYRPKYERATPGTTG